MRINERTKMNSKRLKKRHNAKIKRQHVMETDDNPLWEGNRQVVQIQGRTVVLCQYFKSIMSESPEKYCSKSGFIQPDLKHSSLTSVCYTQLPRRQSRP